MKPYDDDVEQTRHKRRAKHASNRPGKGMKVISYYDDSECDELLNKHVGREHLLELDDNIDVTDEAAYNVKPKIR